MLRLSEKVVVLLNGRGGVGKDTLCALAQAQFRCRMVSSITPVKDLAAQCGWNGEKDARSRKFLSDLKRLVVDYSDLPNRYLREEYRRFLAEETDLLFVQSRERDQIEAFRAAVSGKCFSLLIRADRPGLPQGALGNVSDDQAESFPYDHCFRNDGPLAQAGDRFSAFLREALAAEGVSVREEAI